MTTPPLTDRFAAFLSARDRGIRAEDAVAAAGIGPDDVASIAEFARMLRAHCGIVGKDCDRYREAHRHAHMDGQRLERARTVAWLHEAGLYSHAAALARRPLVEHPVPPEAGVLAYAADSAKEPTA
jgi:hypothetical protein